jgi:hypothetical protein
MRQIGELHQSMNEKLMYIAQLQGEVKAAGERATGDAHEIGALRQMLAETKAALTATEVERDRAQSEANRLQGLLDMIFRSKTWKMHTLLERLRGRR